ncbi:MAG TPA: MG2 domain-containing protein [Vicinamibacterales bacterium]|nr:MG2 domain-containing protein [Vicinamibacterales bacterium]
MTRKALAVVLGLLFSLPVSSSAQQSPGSLTVVSSGPMGEVASLAEANEIRIVFSEPMVVLGRIPQPVTVPYVTIAPAINGSFRWSGTTILIFTPDPTRKLPHATRYDVAVSAAATAVSGRRLGADYRFTFTTPTVRLVDLQWYRRNNRYDGPMVAALRFNQPVRPSDVQAHTVLRFEPHGWDRPFLSAEAQARLTTNDPQALPRFEAKVAAADRAASSTAQVRYTLATDWDRKRFPASPDLVVIELTDAAPPESWVRAEIDASIPAVEGRAVPGQGQSRRIEVERAFFVDGFQCRVQCDPDGWNPIRLRTGIDIDAVRKALSIRNVTNPTRQPIVAPAETSRRGAEWEYDAPEYVSVEDAGYDRQPPDSKYVFRLDASLQSRDGQTLGYTWLDLIENWHARAFSSFGDGHGVWEASGGTMLPFYARNLQSVTQWAVPLRREDLMPRILSLQPSFSAVPPGDGVRRTLKTSADKIESHGLDLSRALLSPRTGLVWAGVREGEPIARSRRLENARDKATIVQVTNLGITVKDSPLNTLVFVTRLDTGEPVPGARVSLITPDNRTLWQGTTGADGVALAGGTPRNKFWQFEFIVTAEKDGDTAYVGSNWHEGLSPWEFGHNFNLRESKAILRGSIFSDRGVYRPGEEVHFKAVLRSDAPSGVGMIPAGTPVYLSLRDSQGRNVDKRTLKVNDWSSIEWTFTLPADGALGNYRVVADLNETPADADRSYEDGYVRPVAGNFLVAAYRRPDFRVDATLGSESSIAGASLAGVVTAKYLFGSSMAKRQVTWRATRVALCSAPAAIAEHFTDSRFVFAGDCDGVFGTEQVAGAETTLDSNGQFTTTLATPVTLGRPYRYTLEGDVEDVSRQHIAGRASFIVHPTPWYVGVMLPAYFIDQKQGLESAVVAVSNEGAIVPGVPVEVTLRQIQWNSVRRAEGQGFYTWETTRNVIEVGKWSVETTDKPVPMSMPLPNGGYFEVTAVGRDADGRSTSTKTEFYALGTGYTAWERFDHNRITLVPEKATYRPGDAARIMIQSPWERATALLTTEREGIRTQRQFTITSTQQYVTVPISEADIPNVYVSVLLVKGRTKDDTPDDGSDPGKPAFRLGYTQLNVEDRSKRLMVNVTANSAEYRPANQARVNVEVKDHRGVATVAEVTLWAVDYGVLSLTAFRTPDILESVYVPKALQVINTDNRQRIVSRRALIPKGEDTGGGGGSEEGVDGLRKDFRVLAFWVGSIVTDASGRASVDLKLPESLTTYRIMAVAADKASRFGSDDSEIRINKPVTLKPAFPRFMAVGDRASFGSVITSQLREPGAAIVTMRSLDPGILEIRGTARQTVQVGANGSAEVRFEAVAKSVGPARIQMTARLGNETDSFEDVIPVEILSSPETVAAYGEAKPDAKETIVVPTGAVPGFGGLHVQLSSTAMVGLNEGARYLVEYPYGCAEQQASRAFALLLTSDLGDAFRLPGIDPKNLRGVSQTTLKGLAKFQCSNGGFSYWPGACYSTSPYLTAYILHVFHEASALKYDVDNDMLERAYTYLQRELAQPNPRDDGWWPAYTAWQTFAVKVLVEGKRNQDSNINRLYQRLDRMPVFALSYLLDALVAKGETGARVNELQRRITNAMLTEAGSAHVEELSDPYLLWFWNSNVRSTSIALRSLMRSNAADRLVRPTVRWLLNARKNGRWGNTQENAWAMEALVAYYRKYESEVPDFRAVVKLANEEIAREAFEGRSAEAKTRDISMSALQAKAAPGSTREITFSRQGTGTLFYITRLRYAADELYQNGLDAGFSIQRRYAPYVESGAAQPDSLSFKAGDLVLVTLSFNLTKERRFVAVTDPLPAGFEPVESWFATTAASLTTAQNNLEEQGTWMSWWQRGGFDHVERHDDRVRLFATRLSEGRHEFSYVVRATTSGTFRTAPAHAEEMYEPEVFGRTGTTIVDVKR